MKFSGLTPESVRSFYDRFGSLQDLQAVYEDRALKILTQHSSFENAGSVLEFGCGTGRLARRLLEEALGPDCHYRGLDISQAKVSLTEGATRVSRSLTALWNSVWTRKPGRMGGCRPVLFAERLDSRSWHIEFYQALVATGLLTSEWVGANPVR